MEGLFKGLGLMANIMAAENRRRQLAELQRQESQLTTQMDDEEMQQALELSRQEQMLQHEADSFEMIPDNHNVENDHDRELADAIARSKRETAYSDIRPVTDSPNEQHDRELADAIARSEEEIYNGTGNVDPVAMSPESQYENRSLTDSQIAAELADEEMARRLHAQMESEGGDSPMSIARPPETDAYVTDLSRQNERLAAEMRARQFEALNAQRRQEEEERDRLKLEAEERDYLRREQDAAYRSALEQDLQRAREEQRQKEEAERMEQEAQRKEMEQQEEAEAKTLSLRLNIENDLNNKRKLVASTMAPNEQAKDACSLVIRKPDGTRLQGRFFASDTLATVQNWVDVQLLEDMVKLLDAEDQESPSVKPQYPLQYHLVTSFPTKRLDQPESTLQQAGLFPRALLNIEMIAPASPSPHSS